MEKHQLEKLVQGCRKQDATSQRLVYEHFYSYIMNVAMHYTKDVAEAKHILNESFFKAFASIQQQQKIGSFKAWLRQITVRTAIDYHRSQKDFFVDMDEEQWENSTYAEPDIFSKIALDELLETIQKLSPAYRLILLLYAIEGYNHEEIGKELGIAASTSRANLSKARKQLKKLLHGVSIF